MEGRLTARGGHPTSPRRGIGRHPDPILRRLHVTRPDASLLVARNAFAWLTRATRLLFFDSEGRSSPYVDGIGLRPDATVMQLPG